MTQIERLYQSTTETDKAIKKRIGKIYPFDMPIDGWGMTMFRALRDDRSIRFVKINGKKIKLK